MAVISLWSRRGSEHSDTDFSHKVLCIFSKLTFRIRRVILLKYSLQQSHNPSYHTRPHSHKQTHSPGRTFNCYQFLQKRNGNGILPQVYLLGVPILCYNAWLQHLLYSATAPTTLHHWWIIESIFFIILIWTAKLIISLIIKRKDTFFVKLIFITINGVFCNFCTLKQNFWEEIRRNGF